MPPSPPPNTKPNSISTTTAATIITTTMYGTNPLPPNWRTLVSSPSSPSFSDLQSLGFHHLKPGKQCPHPCSTWFRDPRPDPPPLPSRASILTKIFREHTTFDARCEAILAHYTPPDNPELLAAEREKERGKKFELFPMLPAEIRQQIWECALPRRVFDLRETRHMGTYTEIRNFLPPVPYIGRVCKEARDVVMRLGTRLCYAWTDQFRSDPWNDPSDPDAGRVKITTMGFFVRGKDLVLHLPDPSSGPELGLEEVERVKPKGEEVTTLTAGSMTAGLKSRETAVNWAPGARPANARTYPGSLLPKVWRTLKTAGDELKTVWVYYRSTFLEVAMVMSEEKDGKEGGLGTFGTEVQLMVDLYDDERLAELQSLETQGEDWGKEGPRFATYSLRNPGLCVNCERVQWEEHVKPAVVCQWLQLFEGELDEASYQNVFHPGAELGYDPDHPWAQEKLRKAPEFCSVVLVHLQVAPEPHRHRE